MAYVVGGSSSPAHHGASGITGFVEHLGKDVGDAALGLPKGIEQLVTHPVRTVEQTGKATWMTWSPLFHGHVAQFGHEFYDHPLAPLLDIATVFTGGAAVAARLGSGLADAGLISETSTLAKLGKMPTKLTVQPTGADRALVKYLPKNPLHNALYRSAYDIVNSSQHIPNWFGEHVFGEHALYSRLHAVDRAHAIAATHLQMAAMLKAGQTLDQIHKLPQVETQLFQRNYFGALDHAPEVPLKQIQEHGLPSGYKYWKVWDGTNPNFFYEKTPATSFEEFSGRVKNFGSNFTTSKIGESVQVRRGGQTYVKLARVHTLKDLGIEGQRSATLLRTLYRAPTKVWKSVLIGYSPRVVINNGVGNWLMYAMRQGGGHSLRGFVDAVRYTRGQKAATEMLRETGTLAKQNLFDKHFADELGNTFINATVGEHRSFLSGPFYPAVHRYADVPVRVASISAFLRGDPAVQALMKQGVGFEDAASRVLVRNPELRARAADHARSIAGDYFTMTPLEHVVRDIMPFYLWDKHIVKHTVNMLKERPAVVAAGTALGAQGSAATRKELGAVPSYMLGLLGLGKQNGKEVALSTQGLNPYATVPDLVDFAQGLVTGGGPNPGEAAAGEVNPVLSGLISHIAGQKPTGGKVVNHGGILPSVLYDTAQSLTPVQLLQRLVNGAPAAPKTPPLYTKDINTLLSSLAGIPIKKADLGRAHQLAAEEATGKKPKKGHSKYVVAG